MADAMTRPVVNIDDLELMDFGHGDGFAARLRPIGGLIGANQLGCMLTVVEPGKKAFPFHVHHANEEMFFVLVGSGEYRFGEETYEIRAGDMLAAPAGGPEAAHQIVNTGDETLKYLAFSTKNQPEVVEYPDSDKFAVLSQSTDGSPMTARIRHIGRPGSSLNYWDGEDA